MLSENISKDINKRIALVSDNDEIIGYGDKIEIHKNGTLHRAFSIVVLNDKKEIMLQKRARSKYHSGGLWTNTCCSHQVETVDFAAYMHFRLHEEMGFDCELVKAFVFQYKVELDDGLSEHEIDHVYFGYFNGEPKLNPEEAEDWAWRDIDWIISDIAANPDSYTYWFKAMIKDLRNAIKNPSF